MNKLLTLLFFAAATLFVLVHILAMEASLYWYFWWADILMHFWGGLLLGLGVHVLASLPNLPLKATVPWLLSIILLVTVSWEVFERSYGLYNARNYIFDTSLDIFLGFAGGLVAHVLLLRK